MMPAFRPSTGCFALELSAPRNNCQTVVELREHDDGKARPFTATKLYARKILVAHVLKNYCIQQLCHSFKNTVFGIMTSAHQ